MHENFNNYASFGDNSILLYAWAVEPPGQWGRVPTIFWEILCHFQKYKAKVSTTNGSKVTTNYEFWLL